MKSKNIITISVTVALMTFFIFSWFTILPIYLKELGATDMEVGISYSIISISFLLFQYPGGILSDTFGRKGLIVYPTFIAAIFFLLGYIFHNWIMLVITASVQNMVSAIQLPAFIPLIAESVPSEKKGTAFSLLELGASGGIALGQLSGGFILRYTTVRNLILLTAIVAFVNGILRFLFLEETHFYKKEKKGFNRAPLSGIMKNKNFVILLIGSALFYAVFSLTIYGPFMAIYSKEVLKLAKANINILYGIGGLGAVGISFLGGYLINKYTDKRVLIGNVLFHVIFLFIWILISPNILYIIPFILIFITSQLGHIAYNSYLTGVFPKDLRSQMIGLFATISGLLSSFTPAIAAYFMIRLTKISPFLLAGIFGIIATILFTKVNDNEIYK